MSKKITHQEYLDALNHFMLLLERDKLETRVKRLITARNKWRKRARFAEKALDDEHSRRK